MLAYGGTYDDPTAVNGVEIISDMTQRENITDIVDFGLITSTEDPLIGIVYFEGRNTFNLR